MYFSNLIMELKTFCCLRRDHLLAFILVSIIAITSGAPVEPADPPCYILKSKQTSNATLNIRTVIDDLIRRTEGLKLSCSDFKDYVEHTLLTPPIVVQGDLIYFVPKQHMTVTAATKQSASKDPLGTMQSHYSLLYHLVNHVQRAREDVGIRKSTGQNNLIKQITDLETEIYNIICDLEIALTGAKIEPSKAAPLQEVSATFLALGGTFTNETLRAYILFKDCKSLMQSLNEIYRAMRV